MAVQRARRERYILGVTCRIGVGSPSTWQRQSCDIHRDPAPVRRRICGLCAARIRMPTGSVVAAPSAAFTEVVYDAARSNVRVSRRRRP
jgi:hypothetical protein